MELCAKFEKLTPEIDNICKTSLKLHMCRSIMGQYKKTDIPRVLTNKLNTQEDDRHLKTLLWNIIKDESLNSIIESQGTVYLAAVSSDTLLKKIQEKNPRFRKFIQKQESKEKKKQGKKNNQEQKSIELLKQVLDINRMSLGISEFVNNTKLNFNEKYNNKCNQKFEEIAEKILKYESNKIQQYIYKGMFKDAKIIDITQENYANQIVNNDKVMLYNTKPNTILKLKDLNKYQNQEIHIHPSIPLIDIRQCNQFSKLIIHNLQAMIICDKLQQNTISIITQVNLWDRKRIQFVDKVIKDPILKSALAVMTNSKQIIFDQYLDQSNNIKTREEFDAIMQEINNIKVFHTLDMENDKSLKSFFINRLLSPLDDSQEFNKIKNISILDKNSKKVSKK